jgi:SAM-dependent methyltransferase
MRAHPVQGGLGDRRRRLLASARGRVLEIGGGYGRNLLHYPSHVESVTFVEPDPAQRAGLLDRVAAAPVRVEVHEAGVDELDSIAPATFDTVVCTLVLCTIDDLDGALGAIKRRVAPNGRLLFLEHVRGGGVASVVQRLARPLWQQVFAGCRPDRDTVAAVRDAGFLITDLERFSMGFVAPVISPAVQGIAKAVAA